MDSSLDAKKQCLIVNVIHFLQDELINGNLNDERKESVEVAIQCLETAFEVDSEVRNNLENDKLDLVSLMPSFSKVVVTEEQMKEAEICKNNGNSHMKNSLYLEALAEYSKAISLNPNNAVYYCNRAAAYSRLEKHLEAINDCKQAIKLDPTYGKAYGRLGIAYSNLNQFDEACQAYKNALKHDPGNAMYETNLKLAEEKMFCNMESAAPPEHRPLDISQFINNPNLINMATQMLSDSNFRNLMSRFMSVQSGDPNLDALIQAGQTLASRMHSADPNFVENLRRSLDPQNLSGQSQSQSDSNVTNDKSNDDEKKSE
ncbi:unnamed protein product [Psylliodes chrysocephalus]|uniref:SGTA homodimerisation domain-containing protein n=1 Tax=Psylliodes chrysocephalus TaxID=3402493 RepID=A0A9P0G5Y2_9CUCU|nr:unnamed protein product [Psylliodes chrysocephala]